MCCWVQVVTEALLQVEHVSKRFGGIVASDDITLLVPAGELHAIIGPNGAGKSTLIGQPQPARSCPLVPDHIAVP